MASRPQPSQSEVERAFQDAMTAAGYQPGRIEADTEKFVRFDAPGDKAGRQNGFYKLKTGAYPVGWFGDWKLGEQQQWSWHEHTGQTLSAQDRAAMKREQAKLKAQAAQARETRQAEVAEDASAIWNRADANVEGHQYLARKRIDVPRGLRIHIAKDGTRLLAVPMRSFDLNGQKQLTSLQLISGEGEKRFLTGGRVAGTFFDIGGDSSIIIVCEGVATAFSIWKATGLSTVAAFNSGNLVEVAREIARNRPLAKLLIAADDDRVAPHDWETRGKGRPWKNEGVLKGEAAAKAVGCRWITPVFTDGADRSRTDFNDLFVIEGEQAVAGQVMGAFRSLEAEEAQPGAQIIEPDFIQDESWRRHIPQTSAGNPDGANVNGVAIYIASHRLLRDRLQFNAFSKEVELDANALEDYSIAEFRRIMHAEGFKAKKGDVADEMIAEARRHTFDPLTDYLSRLKWDGRSRLTTWMADYLGAANSLYVSAVGRAVMIGSVARALLPGCKLDTMVILEGPQGTGKSTGIRYLYGDRFFTDNLPDFHSKDSFQQLQGSWCVEVAELNKMSKADVGDVKQFLSRIEDKFRPPYERMPVKIKRRTVLWGTVNPEDGSGYLKDQTGNRRFYPVEAGVIDLGAVLRDRDQLWAEAVRAYQDGEPWYLDGEMAEVARVEQDARREKHPWEAVLRDWLLTTSRSEATIEEALDGAIKLPAERWDTRTSRAVGAAFKALGWNSMPAWRSGRTVRVFMSPEAAKRMNLSGGPGPRGDLVDALQP